jgi:hypothetical protein
MMLALMHAPTRALSFSAGRSGPGYDKNPLSRSKRQRAPLSAHARNGQSQAEEFGLALGHHTRLREVLAEEALVLVLSEDEHVGEGAEAFSHVTKGDTCGSPSAHPQVRGRELQSSLDRRFCQTDLPVELERAGLHAQGPRCGSRSGGLVENADADVQALWFH